MNFLSSRALCCALLLITACRSGSENVRGKTRISPAAKSAEQTKNNDDPVGQFDPNQAPVIIDNNDTQPLKLVAEADQSGLPAGFMEDIFAIHKIDGSKTLLYGRSKQAWLHDESREGVLTKLTVDIAPPADTTLYVLENKNFWLISKSSVAFPSTASAKDADQVTLINLAPDLLKNSETSPRILYAGPQRLIMANDKRANIVVLDGDKARVIALDFPKMGDNVVSIIGAGLMQNSDSFWFLSAERLLLLKKNGEGRWRWVVSKFKLDGGGQAPEGKNQIAMVLEAKDDKSFAYVGRTFELDGGKIFEQNPIKLSVDIQANPGLDPTFLNDVQPLLKNYCTPCHAGYEDYATVKGKARVYRQLIENGSMPKNMALSAVQIKTLTDYLTRVLSAPQQ